MYRKHILVELIQAAEKVIEEEKSDDIMIITQILRKAIQVAKASIELKDS